MSGILSAVFRRGIRTTAPRMNAESSNARTWRKVSLLVVLPCIGIMTGLQIMEMRKHHGCKPDRPPFVKYEHMRIRNKRFPWGDGNRTLFHNPEINPLPDGYEDELEPTE